MNPFEGMKSEDEEEDLALTDRRGEEEEVDEEELQAFLDGELGNRLPFLQDDSCQGIVAENQENNPFSIPSSKAEDALRTRKFPFMFVWNSLFSLYYINSVQLREEHCNDVPEAWTFIWTYMGPIPESFWPRQFQCVCWH